MNELCEFFGSVDAVNEYLYSIVNTELAMNPDELSMSETGSLYFTPYEEWREVTTTKKDFQEPVSSAEERQWSSVGKYRKELSRDFTSVVAEQEIDLSEKEFPSLKAVKNVKSKKTEVGMYLAKVDVKGDQKSNGQIYWKDKKTVTTKDPKTGKESTVTKPDFKLNPEFLHEVKITSFAPLPGKSGIFSISTSDLPKLKEDAGLAFADAFQSKIPAQFFASLLAKELGARHESNMKIVKKQSDFFWNDAFSTADVLGVNEIENFFTSLIKVTDGKSAPKIPENTFERQEYHLFADHKVSNQFQTKVDVGEYDTTEQVHLTHNIRRDLVSKANFGNNKEVAKVESSEHLHGRIEQHKSFFRKDGAAVLSSHKASLLGKYKESMAGALFDATEKVPASHTKVKNMIAYLQQSFGSAQSVAKDTDELLTNLKGNSEKFQFTAHDDKAKRIWKVDNKKMEKVIKDLAAKGPDGKSCEIEECSFMYVHRIQGAKVKNKDAAPKTESNDDGEKVEVSGFQLTEQGEAVLKELGIDPEDLINDPDFLEKYILQGYVVKAGSRLVEIHDVPAAENEGYFFANFGRREQRSELRKDFSITMEESTTNEGGSSGSNGNSGSGSTTGSGNDGNSGGGDNGANTAGNEGSSGNGGEVSSNGDDSVAQTDNNDQKSAANLRRTSSQTEQEDANQKAQDDQENLQNNWTDHTVRITTDKDSWYSLTERVKTETLDKKTGKTVGDARVEERLSAVGDAMTGGITRELCEVAAQCGIPLISSGRKATMSAKLQDQIDEKEKLFDVKKGELESQIKDRLVDQKRRQRSSSQDDEDDSDTPEVTEDEVQNALASSETFQSLDISFSAEISLLKKEKAFNDKPLSAAGKATAVGLGAGRVTCSMGTQLSNNVLSGVMTKADCTNGKIAGGAAVTFGLKMFFEWTSAETRNIDPETWESDYRGLKRRESAGLGAVTQQEIVEAKIAHKWDVAKQEFIQTSGRHLRNLEQAVVDTSLNVVRKLAQNGKIITNLGKFGTLIDAASKANTLGVIAAFSGAAVETTRFLWQSIHAECPEGVYCTGNRRTCAAGFEMVDVEVVDKETGEKTMVQQRRFRCPRTVSTENVKQSFATASGGAVGTSAGGWVGGLIGSALGPLGTTVGTCIGGAIGGWWAGNKVMEADGIPYVTKSQKELDEEAQEANRQKRFRNVANFVNRFKNIFTIAMFEYLKINGVNNEHTFVPVSEYDKDKKIQDPRTKKWVLKYPLGYYTAADIKEKLKKRKVFYEELFKDDPDSLYSEKFNPHSFARARAKSANSIPDVPDLTVKMSITGSINVESVGAFDLFFPKVNEKETEKKKRLATKLFPASYESPVVYDYDFIEKNEGDRRRLDALQMIFKKAVRLDAMGYYDADGVRVMENYSRHPDKCKTIDGTWKATKTHYTYLPIYARKTTLEQMKEQFKEVESDIEEMFRPEWQRTEHVYGSTAGKDVKRITNGGDGDNLAESAKAIAKEKKKREENSSVKLKEKPKPNVKRSKRKSRFVPLSVSDWFSKAGSAVSGIFSKTEDVCGSVDLVAKEIDDLFYREISVFWEVNYEFWEKKMKGNDYDWVLRQPFNSEAHGLNLQFVFQETVDKVDKYRKMKLCEDNSSLTGAKAKKSGKKVKFAGTAKKGDDNTQNSKTRDDMALLSDDEQTPIDPASNMFFYKHVVKALAQHLFAIDYKCFQSADLMIIEIAKGLASSNKSQDWQKEKINSKKTFVTEALVRQDKFGIEELEHRIITTLGTGNAGARFITEVRDVLLPHLILLEDKESEDQEATNLKLLQEMLIKELAEFNRQQTAIEDLDFTKEMNVLRYIKQIDLDYGTKFYSAKLKLERNMLQISKTSASAAEVSKRFKEQLWNAWHQDFFRTLDDKELFDARSGMLNPKLNTEDVLPARAEIFKTRFAEVCALFFLGGETTEFRLSERRRMAEGAVVAVNSKFDDMQWFDGGKLYDGRNRQGVVADFVMDRYFYSHGDENSEKYPLTEYSSSSDMRANTRQGGHALVNPGAVTDLSADVKAQVQKLRRAIENGKELIKQVEGVLAQHDDASSERAPGMVQISGLKEKVLTLDQQIETILLEAGRVKHDVIVKIDPNVYDGDELFMALASQIWAKAQKYGLENLGTDGNAKLFEFLDEKVEYSGNIAWVNELFPYKDPDVLYEPLQKLVKDGAYSRSGRPLISVLDSISALSQMIEHRAISSQEQLMLELKIFISERLRHKVADFFSSSVNGAKHEVLIEMMKSTEDRVYDGKPRHFSTEFGELPLHRECDVRQRFVPGSANPKFDVAAACERVPLDSRLSESFFTSLRLSANTGLSREIVERRVKEQVSDYLKENESAELKILQKRVATFGFDPAFNSRAPRFDDAFLKQRLEFNEKSMAYADLQRDIRSGKAKRLTASEIEKIETELEELGKKQISSIAERNEITAHKMVQADQFTDALSISNAIRPYSISGRTDAQQTQSPHAYFSKSQMSDSDSLTFKFKPGSHEEKSMISDKILYVSHKFIWKKPKTNATGKKHRTATKRTKSLPLKKFEKIPDHQPMQKPRLRANPHKHEQVGSTSNIFGDYFGMWHDVAVSLIDAVDGRQREIRRHNEAEESRVKRLNKRLRKENKENAEKLRKQKVEKLKYFAAKCVQIGLGELRAIGEPELEVQLYYKQLVPAERVENTKIAEDAKEFVNYDEKYTEKFVKLPADAIITRVSGSAPQSKFEETLILKAVAQMLNVKVAMFTGGKKTQVVEIDESGEYFWEKGEEEKLIAEAKAPAKSEANSASPSKKIFPIEDAITLFKLSEQFHGSVNPLHVTIQEREVRAVRVDKSEKGCGPSTASNSCQHKGCTGCGHDDDCELVDDDVCAQKSECSSKAANHVKSQKTKTGKTKTDQTSLSSLLKPDKASMRSRYIHNPRCIHGTVFSINGQAFCRRDVANNGDCLFIALANQENSEFKEEDLMRDWNLRVEIVDNIPDIHLHADILADLSIELGTVIDSPAEYRKIMSNRGVWGSELEIVTYSRLRENFEIHVFSYDANGEIRVQKYWRGEVKFGFEDNFIRKDDPEKVIRIFHGDLALGGRKGSDGAENHYNEVIALRAQDEVTVDDVEEGDSDFEDF